MYALAVAATPGLAPGIVGLFMESGWIGKVIMMILLCFSVVSWAMILLKFQYLRKAEKESLAFLQVFRRTKNIDELLASAKQMKFSPVATLFLDGHKEVESIVKSLPGGTVTEADRPLIGAIGGAAVGANTRGPSYDVQRCAAVPGTGQPSYWDVTYLFRGREYRAQLAFDPGPTITGNGRGEPRV